MEKKEKKRTAIKSKAFKVRTAVKAGSMDQLLADAMKDAKKNLS